MSSERVEPGTASAGIARSSFGSRDGSAALMLPDCPAAGQPHPQVERLFRNYFRQGRSDVADYCPGLVDTRKGRWGHIGAHGREIRCEAPRTRAVKTWFRYPPGGSSANSLGSADLRRWGGGEAARAIFCGNGVWRGPHLRDALACPAGNNSLGCRTRPLITGGHGTFSTLTTRLGREAHPLDVQVLVYSPEVQQPQRRASTSCDLVRTASLRQ